MILLQNEGLTQLAELQHRLSESQINPASLAGREHAISFSVGMADSRQTPFSMLYKMADKAMYQQKQSYYEAKRTASERALEDSYKSV